MDGNKVAEIEQRVSKIEERNRRVERDKAWETSGARKVILILLTWLTIGIYFSFISIPRPWINAIVPAIGFFLSTLTLPYFKKIWEKFI